MNKKILNLSRFTLKSCLIVISALEVLFLLLCRTPRNGLEEIWVLPLIFCLCICFFGRIIKYHEGGIGLKIFYSILIIRYLLHPLLICLSNGELSSTRTPNAEANDYRIAIIVYCIEIVVSCLTIAILYPRSLKIDKYKNIEKKIHKNISVTFWCLVCFGVLILLLRFGIWFSQLNFFAIKTSDNSVPILLEASIFNSIKSLIFVIALQKLLEFKNHNKNYYLILIIVIMLGMINIITYFGTNRAFVVDATLATISILYLRLPQYRKQILITIVPISLVLIINMFVDKQFGDSNVSVITDSLNSYQSTSNIIEEYVNGLWVVAKTHQVAGSLQGVNHLKMLVKDISDGFLVVLNIPGLKWINLFFSDISSTTDIFRNFINGVEINRGQIPSFSANVFMIFGDSIGWIAMPIIDFLAVKFLIYYEIRAKFLKTIRYQYMYIWMSVLMGLTFCYNLQILIYCWSKYILFYWAVIKIDDIYHVTFSKNYIKS